MSNRLTMGGVRASSAFVRRRAAAGVLGSLARRLAGRARRGRRAGGRRAAGHGRARPLRRVRDAAGARRGRPRRARRAYPCAYMHRGDDAGARRARRARRRGARLGDARGSARGSRRPTSTPDDLAYHVYLVEGARERGGDARERRATSARASIARAPSPCSTRRSRAGCALDALVAREIARAVLYRVAPATAEGIARAQTTYLAQLIVPCAVGLAVDAAQAFQSRPERAVCDARAGEVGTSPDDERRAHDAGTRERVHRGRGALLGAASTGPIGRAPGVDRHGVVGARADDDRRRRASAGTTSPTRSTCSA